MARELSGIAWVERFPTSKTTDTLIDGFRQKCEAFFAALEDAGATVSINATLRPPERACLMHWSFVINTGEVEPDDVPEHAGVEIDWMHRKPKPIREFPRLCRGGSKSLTYTGVGSAGPSTRLRIMSREAHERESHRWMTMKILNPQQLDVRM
jgi:hypothetical protein